MVVKHNGIEWIGDIPSDWEIKRFKYLVVDIKSGDSLTNEMLSDDDTLYPVFGGGKQIGYYEKSNVTSSNLLIGRVGANCGCITKIIGKAWATDNALIVNSHDKTNYLYYLLLTTNLNNMSDTNAQPLITASKVLNIKIPFCIDIQERHAIATFLDIQCSKVDNIITELEQQIEILKQYKTSLITETVTKGLNKNVPMKNSGINWIGEIPTHWEVKKLKYLTINANTGEAISKEFWDPDGDYLLYTAGQFPIRSTFNEFPKNIMTSENDILVARNGAGAVQIPQLGSIYTDHVIRFTIKTGNCKKYIFYTLLLGMEKIVNEAIDVSLKTLSRSDWDNLSLPFPTISEQQAIAALLDSKCKEITDIITEKQQSIDTMKAYKKSLIYEYVTGKKRVKGYS
jgi:type I restriction enzyme S subunit